MTSTPLLPQPVLTARYTTGCSGTGKSSLVSTVDSLVKGQLTRRAVCGSEAEGPMTKVMKRYEFSRGSCNLPLVLWDTAGWAEGPAHDAGATCVAGRSFPMLFGPIAHIIDRP